MLNNLLSVYDLIVYALITGALISLCAALLGVSLVLKRFSMIGDGLSHVGFGASAIALSLGLTPLYVSIPVTVIASFLLLKTEKLGAAKGDALIAVISCSALAIGYTVSKLTHSTNIDINSYMFGSIYTVDREDMLITAALSAIILALYFIFYNKLFSVTFDEEFAVATGINVGLYKSLLAVLSALTVSVGMRLVGALLISGLIVFPALTASTLSKSYKGVILLSAASGIFCFFSGLVFSFFTEASPGASIIIVSLAVFLISAALSAIKKFFKESYKKDLQSHNN